MVNKDRKMGKVRGLNDFTGVDLPYVAENPDFTIFPLFLQLYSSFLS